MSFDFSGKKILVTGASKGIGRAISVALARAGCKVYALARSKDLLDQLAAESSNIVPVVQDLSNWDQTKATLEQLETMDGLVNNAGILLGLGPALEHTREDMEKYMEMHVLAAINCTQAVGKKMVDAGRQGSIVNISSVDSLGAYPGMLGYCVSKAALDMVTKQFALELGPSGIRVNSVNPTMVKTDLVQAFPSLAAIVEEVVARTPLERIANIEEVIQPVLYLLSDSAAMVTGTTHPIEGGWTCNITRKQ